MTISLKTESLLAFGSGQKGGVGSLTDPDLLDTFRQYRKNVAKRYRVVDAETLERALPDGPLWLSTKLDGELWFLVKRADQVLLCAYNGRVLVCGPLLAEAQLRLSHCNDIVIAGELIAVPDSGRPRVHHVTAALSSPDGEQRLRFYAFDVVEESGAKAQDTSYPQRLGKLETWFEGGSLVSSVTTVATTKTEALAYYREWVGTQRFEGMVVRGEQGLTYKVKPRFSIDAVVIAYGSRVLTGIEQIRELTVGLRRDDGTIHVLGSVGSGFTEEDRVQWHARLRDMKVPSSFRMVNRDGTLCSFVRPEIVIEVLVTDLVETDASDVPVSRMRLAYDEAGYRAVGDGPIAAMLFPTFLRERTDKVPDASNIGLDQITSRLALDEDSTVQGLEPVHAVVVERRVFVKGETAVRKYVVIDTQKGGALYPPFVVYFTDFSVGRAEPLKSALRPCSSLDAARVHVAGWLEENVKRGWVEVGSSASVAAGDKDEAPAKSAPAKPRAPRKKKAPESPEV